MTDSAKTSKRKALAKVAAEGDGRRQVQADARTGARRGSAARPDLDAQMLVRVPREWVYWLRRHALDRHEPYSEIVRRIIGQYIAAHGGAGQ